MKLNLEDLKYLYKYLKENKKLEEVFEDNKVTFEDFKQYILNTIINNVEYDFGINFYDYVDINNFIKESD